MDEIRLSDSDIEELRAAFFQQAAEILENLPEHIMRIETSPDEADTSAVEDGWRALKRDLHTLKGDSKAMGFSGLSAFAHTVEDLIADIKDKAADKKTIDLLFECSDALKTFIGDLARGEEPDTAYIITKIDSHRRSEGLQARSDIPLAAENRLKKGGKRDMKGLNAQQGLSFLKIDSRRVDRIMDLIGELVISRSMLNQITADIGTAGIAETRSKLEGINSSFERSLTDLQRSIMKVRMLPIEHVFRKFPRIVRELSAETGKSIKLSIEGEKTELDKGIIDVIGEPLLHLVRNAIDHGIEPPDARTKKGKLEGGTITLRAFHQGNQIVIEVEDDGAGIDREAMRKAALQKGILSHEDARKLSDRDALNLIYLPGLSTASRVTEVSGRGVGMDIIKEAIESLRGMIDITSEKDKGTTVTLRLPLTLAIIKAILFKEAGETFALPLGSVLEIRRVEPEEIESIAGLPALNHRMGLMPLCGVKNLAYPGKTALVIIIGVAQMRAGILVEKILREESLVIKALEGEAAAGIAAGASILGDGKVVLILDPLLLIKKAREGASGV